MKTIIKLILIGIFICGFSNILKAQEVDNLQEALIENDWYLIKIVIDDEEHLFSPNEEIEQVILSFSIDPDENDHYLFSPALCESVDWRMHFAGENDFIAEEAVNWALTWCSNIDNIYYDNFYYFGFWKAYEDSSFYYTINESEEIKELIISNDIEDKAYYQNVPNMSINNQHTSNLTIFPNPGQDHLYIENLTEPVEIEIYNLSGKVLLSQEVNEVSKQVNLSQLSEGIYLYQFSQNGRKVKMGKLVKK